TPRRTRPRRAAGGAARDSVVVTSEGAGSEHARRSASRGTGVRAETGHRGVARPARVVAWLPARGPQAGRGTVVRRPVRCPGHDCAPLDGPSASRACIEAVAHAVLALTEAGTSAGARGAARSRLPI